MRADTGKTKAQLVNELEQLRRRVAELETAASRSPDKYQWLVENLNEMVFTLDLEGRFTYVSPAAEDVAGYTPEEVLGQPFTRFVYPDDLQKATTRFEQVLAGDLKPNEFRAVHKDGSVRYVRTSSRPIYKNGQLVAVTGILEDVTERTRAEAALRESEQKYRSLINGLANPIALFDRDGALVLINEIGAMNLGGAPDDFIGKSVHELFPDLAEKFMARFRQIVQSGVGNDFHDLFDLPSGARWFWSVVEPLRDADDRIVGVQVVSHDITERKRAEDALRANEARLAAAELIADFGSWDWDLINDELFWSAGLCRIFGTTTEQFDKKYSSFLDFLPPEERDATMERVDRAIKGIEPLDYEHRIVRPDGTERVVHAKAEVTFDNTGRAIRMLGTAHDITERKRAEENRRKLEAQVQHAQKLESLGVLAGGIAHHFNNLLTGILGNAELALADTSLASPARDRIRDIETTARRAADLTEQMLAYSGRGRFVVGTVSLNETVEEMEYLFEVAVSKNAVLQYDLADDLPAIEADVSQIRQVLMNLVTNASEAIGDSSGVISVSTGAIECDRNYLAETYLDDELPEGAYVYLEVSDTGCGMDEETQSNLFDPFFTTKFTGRGLGLAALLGIVRGHRGAIKVCSEVGRGTTVKVLFPAADRPAEPQNECWSELDSRN